MALAIYRKYRPRVLEDILGQDLLVEVLKNAAKRDKLSHAYLFYGPRGSGKTTGARILAKIANCETRQTDKKFHDTGEPCNHCRPCMEIDEGRALDVVEIDAASNRGIDEIRNLKEGIKLYPTSYRYKVFIIDEVHQLTKEAFNALLKTLEEPPEHAIFILATTEYDKLPATIISRTQRFSFNRLSARQILEKLKTIAKSEKIEITDDALELIAVAAEGSFRDAESLLEQVISMEDKADLKAVEQLLGKVGIAKTIELVDHMIKNDLSGSLDVLEKIDESGYNLVQLNHDLIHYLRRVLVLKFDANMEKVFESDLTPDELKNLKKHSLEVDADKGIKLLKSLIRAYSEMRYSPFAIVPIEVAIIENLK